jgi:hypothetical protein
MVDKPKELSGLNQKVGGWFGGMLDASDTGSTPTGRKSGPKVLVVQYAERINLMPSPFWAG